MKKQFSLLIALLLLFSCKEAIKNEPKLIVENTFEEIQFIEPETTNSLIINSIDDLLGYWVGDFEADVSDSKLDSLYSGNKYYLVTRKITISFDKIKGDSLFGHSIVVGNICPFKGVYKFENNFLVINLNENNGDLTDGLFDMTIKKTDSLLIGNWQILNSENVEIPKRKYSLSKKIFQYDSEAKINYDFINEDKSRTSTYNDTINGVAKNIEYEEYFATTEKVLDKNASSELLDKEFVSNLTKADIYILRNSIFARHGFAFRDKQLRLYFEAYNWYMPVFGDVKDDLTDIEKQNIELLLRYEKNAEEYYDTFGR